MPGLATEETLSSTDQPNEPTLEAPVETELSAEVIPTPTEELQAEIPPDVYTIAVIIDQTSEPVTQEQAQAVIDEASAIFQERTGFSIVMIDFLEMMPEQAERRSDLPQRYLDTRPAIIPNGIVLFSYGDNHQARNLGGYSSSIHGPARYSSHFPVNGDDSLITVSTIHFSHRYAICGYDPDHRDELVSDVSLGGQCRNRPGTSCVERFGYSMCADAVDDLYASTPTYMAASSIVHEIAHPFGRHGNGDHYGTPDCQEEMGWNSSNWTFSLDDFQGYTGICPYVYDLIAESFQP